MGYISLTFLTTFTILVAYGFFLSGVHAELQTGDVGSQPTANEVLHKRRPVGNWIKALPALRLKPYAVYRRDMQPSDVEIIDDSANNIEKRFDDYGHMR